jgi:glyoxylase-like metal-dependent hydrolase (beta-lactamase superfamily II)
MSHNPLDSPRISPVGIPNRRQFCRLAGTGAGYLWWWMTSGAARTLANTSPKIVDRQPWAYLQELAEGVWAAVSTPLESNDWTTACNGGLIAGQERVVAIESFVRPAGAEWLAQQAFALTGRRPTDVVITHFHGDHANGLEGYAGTNAPTVWATRTTRDLIRDEDAQREEPPSSLRLEMLEGVSLIAPDKVMKLDLGGRAVTLHPRRGHTPSDVTIELAEPSVVFSGDLVWNGLFPNYRDTEPSAFTKSIRSLRRPQETTYVSGHGALASGPDVDRLLTLVESVGEAARRAHKKGVPYTEGAAEFALPFAVSDWLLFNPKYFEVAFKAWYAELDAA